MNRVFLSGHLTREPQTRHIPASGSVVCNFGLAVNEKWRDARNGTQRESVCFVEISAWNRQAEVIQEYFKKGSPILIEGNLQFESWQAQDGTQRNRLTVRLQRFEFVGPNPNGTPPVDEIEQPDEVNPESVEPAATEPEPNSTTEPASDPASDPVPQMKESENDDDVPF